MKLPVVQFAERRNGYDQTTSHVRHVEYIIGILIGAGRDQVESRAYAGNCVGFFTSRA